MIISDPLNNTIHHVFEGNVYVVVPNEDITDLMRSNAVGNPIKLSDFTSVLRYDTEYPESAQGYDKLTESEARSHIQSVGLES